MAKRVLITGANRGIGLALSELYAARGVIVYALCRQTSDALSRIDGVKVVTGIDVTSDADLMNLKNTLLDIKLDVIINNAGIFLDERLGEINVDAVVRQFTVNAIGPLKTTEVLLDNLAPGSKIALITSRMGSIGDNSSGSYYGYRMSKAALNAAGMSLAQDLKQKQIAVCLLHPGFVQTEMVNHAGDISPAVAAAGLAERIDGLSMDSTGTFWHSNGEQLPW